MRPSSSAGNGTRHTLRAVLVGVSIWLVLAALAAALLERERRQAIAQSMRAASTFAAVLEENTARAFGSVDVALQALSVRFGELEPARHDPVSREVMRSLLPGLPAVRALFVIGPDGLVQHDTDYPRTPDVSLADREYFRQYLADASLQRGLSSPLLSRSGTGWFVASTRRITGRDGSFRGIVVAAVQLDTLSRLFTKLDMGEGQRLSLYQRDGRLFASHPDSGPEVGKSHAGLALFTQHLPRARAGVYRTSEPAPSQARIVGYRQLERQPLVVTFSESEASVLAPWRRALAAVIAGLGLAALLVAGGVLLFVQRQEHARRSLEHQAAEARARSHAQDMAAADRQKTEFLATLSHELRNVLAPIHNGVMLMTMPQTSAEQSARALGIVRRQVAQMRRLVDDLLDVSRVSSGKVRLELEDLDLQPVLAAGAEAAAAFMEPKGHRFEADWPDEPLQVRIDRHRMLQVLANLLANAAKYTPAGGLVRLQAWREGDEAVVRVTDSGIGIPPESLGKVFTMFEQVRDHEERSEGGLGIGLALVHKLLELQGGRIEVDSAGRGQGTAFTLRLALLPAAAG